jgi:hypothetical protein
MEVSVTSASTAASGMSKYSSGSLTQGELEEDFSSKTTDWASEFWALDY